MNKKQSRSTIKEEYYELVKDDTLKHLFLRDFNQATDTLYYRINKKLVGAVLVVPRYFIFPTVTWIVDKDYRNKGIASKLLFQMVQKHKILFAKINKGRTASYLLARKFSFKTLFRWFYLCH